MAKNVYSLVLDDSLIRLLDQVAYKKGVSRSNMINNIIAEYLCYETPEKRTADIFSSIQSSVDESQTLKFLAQQTTNCLATVYGALTYRYNPTVKFIVEIYKNSKTHIGQLKVSLRSTNLDVLSAVNKFYWMFYSLETKHIGQVDCQIDGEKYTRKLRLSHADELDSNTLGQIITSYVKVFNTLLNLYFANLLDLQTAYSSIDAVYLNYLNSQSYKIT